MRLIAAGWLGLAAATLGGCATLVRGTTDEVAVISDPPGASVTSSIGVGCAATPCVLLVKRKDTFSVTVSKAGYASRTVAVSTRLSSAGAAIASENLTTAGFGLAVDAATGGALEHVPNPVSVTLPSLGQAAPIVRKPAGIAAPTRPVP